MTVDEFFTLLATNAVKAEEYLQDPNCSIEIKREYLNDFDFEEE